MIIDFITGRRLVAEIAGKSATGFEPELRSQQLCVCLNIFNKRAIFKLFLGSILKNMTKRAYKRNILLSFGVSLIVLILSSAASWFSIQNLLDSEKWVNHTVKVISQLDFIISRMKDAETGERGYLLTKDTVFLQPFNGAQTAVEAAIDSAKRKTIDNAAQQNDFLLLSTLVNKNIQYMDRNILTNRGGGMVSVADMRKGKEMMDSLRAHVKLMKNRELKLMHSRTDRLNKYVVYTPILVVIASLIALIITLVFFNRVNKDAQYAAKLQEDLVRKEQETKKQIDVIEKMAKRIAGGDYETRITDADLDV